MPSLLLPACCLLHSKHLSPKVIQEQLRYNPNPSPSSPGRSPDREMHLLRFLLAHHQRLGDTLYVLTQGTRLATMRRSRQQPEVGITAAEGQQDQQQGPKAVGWGMEGEEEEGVEDYGNEGFEGEEEGTAGDAGTGSHRAYGETQSTTGTALTEAGSSLAAEVEVEKPTADLACESCSEHLPPQSCAAYTVPEGYRQSQVFRVPEEAIMSQESWGQPELAGWSPVGTRKNPLYRVTHSSGGGCGGAEPAGDALGVTQGVASGSAGAAADDGSGPQLLQLQQPYNSTTSYSHDSYSFSYDHENNGRGSQGGGSCPGSLQASAASGSVASTGPSASGGRGTASCTTYLLSESDRLGHGGKCMSVDGSCWSSGALHERAAGGGTAGERGVTSYCSGSGVLGNSGSSSLAGGVRNPYLAFPSAAAVAVAGHPTVCRKSRRRAGVGRQGQAEGHPSASLRAESGCLESGEEEGTGQQPEQPSCLQPNQQEDEQLPPQEQLESQCNEDIRSLATGELDDNVGSSGRVGSRGDSSHADSCVEERPSATGQMKEELAMSTAQLQVLIGQQLLAFSGRAGTVVPPAEDQQQEQELTALCALMQQFVMAVGGNHLQVRKLVVDSL